MKAIAGRAFSSASWRMRWWIRCDWTAEPPDWFSPLHNGRFALLDYGETAFVITDADRGFFGLNFGTRRDSLLALGGCDESI